MSIIERAFYLRSVIEKVMAEQNDRVASEAPEFYPKMEYSGNLIKAGTRINHFGKVMKAAADLWDTAENDPENAPELWKELDFIDGIRIIPKAISVTEAFGLEELGFWKEDGKIYKSLLSANVYTPKEYPSGWEEVK